MERLAGRGGGGGGDLALEVVTVVSERWSRLGCSGLDRDIAQALQELGLLPSRVIRRLRRSHALKSSMVQLLVKPLPLSASRRSIIAQSAETKIAAAWLVLFQHP